MVATHEKPSIEVVKMPSVLIKNKWVPEEFEELIRNYSPKSDLGKLVKEVLPALPREQALDLFDTLQRTMVAESSLKLKVFRSPDSRFLVAAHCLVEDYDVVSRKVITTAGVNFLADAFQNSVEIELMNFHGIGTGTTAAVIGDTDVETELTTEYNPNSTRDTGTQGEGSSANIYQTVGLNTLDSGTPAVTEHGVLSSATVGAGTLWDRHVFSAINLDGTAGDGLQSTYEATFSAGG